MSKSSDQNQHLLDVRYQTPGDGWVSRLWTAGDRIGDHCMVLRTAGDGREDHSVVGAKISDSWGRRTGSTLTPTIE